MPFVSTKDNGGQVDKNINKKGQPLKPKVRTNRQIREEEYLKLLRKIKPKVATAILTASQIMENKEARDADKLKACVILLDNYKELVGEIYDKDHDEAEVEAPQQEPVPMFSLKVVEQKTA